MIEFTLPIKTINESNGSHGHWGGKSSRRKKQRKAVAQHFESTQSTAYPTPPVVITLTRISAGELDEHDNLRSAFKAIVDEIAKFYGLHDKHPMFTWQYAQEKSKRGTYGVRITITPKGEA